MKLTFDVEEALSQCKTLEDISEENDLLKRMLKDMAKIFLTYKIALFILPSQESKFLSINHRKKPSWNINCYEKGELCGNVKNVELILTVLILAGNVERVILTQDISQIKAS